MKIDLIINALTGGGAERVMATLANGLSKKNKVSLITFNEGDAFELDTEVQRVRLHHGKIRNHTLRSWINLFSYYKKKSARPDVAVVFMPPNALIVAPIAKLLGIKVIVSEHNNHKANPSKKATWVRKLFYPLVNAVTILTSYDLEFFKKRSKKVVIMPNPIIVPDKVAAFRNRKKTILVAGSLKRYQVKGFDSLLNIVAPLLKENKDWSVSIAGSGDIGLQKLQQQSKELMIENQVAFLGFCKNMDQVMQGAQVFALPSQYEGLPMVLMEAISNGMACIAYDCVSGPGDLIENGNNGLLIADQDAVAFQKGLRRLLEDGGLRYSLAHEGPKSMTNYDLSRILDKWEELFKEVIDGA